MQFKKGDVVFFQWLDEQMLPIICEGTIVDPVPSNDDKPKLLVRHAPTFRTYIEVSRIFTTRYDCLVHVALNINERVHRQIDRLCELIRAK
jgi:hypothetical protein